MTMADESKEEREELVAEWSKFLQKESAVSKAKEAWDNVNPKPTFEIKSMDGKPAVEVGLKFSF